MNKFFISLILICVYFFYNFGFLANIQHFLNNFFFSRDDLQILGFLSSLAFLFTNLKNLSKNYIIAFLLILLFLIITLIKVIFGISYINEFNETILQNTFPLTISLALILIIQKYRVQANLAYLLETLILTNIILGILQWWLRKEIIWPGSADSGWQAYIYIYAEDIHGYIYRAFGVNETPVVYGIIGCVIFLSMIYKINNSKALTKRVFNLIILSLASIAIYCSINRTVWLVCIISTFLYYKKDLVRTYFYNILSGAVSIFGPLIIIFLSGFRDILFQNRFTSSLGVRTADIPNLFSIVLDDVDSILLGTNMELIRRVDISRVDGMSSNPLDNEILYIYAKYGVLGFLLLLGVYYMLSSFIKYELNKNNSLIVLASLFLGVSVGGITNVILIQNMPLILCIYILIFKKSIKYSVPNRDHTEWNSDNKGVDCEK